MIVLTAAVIGGFLYCIGPLVSGSFLVLPAPEYDLSFVDGDALLFAGNLIGDLDCHGDNP
ncbi:hypothetical protein SDC9_186112 [bioreactor metagenome]|uniref:Uncharacterized protein n=1 Tax=bioreactor metagenome TaxID=1076179 RepID=A0A645HHS2_9ZZZZ